ISSMPFPRSSVRGRSGNAWRKSSASPCARSTVRSYSVTLPARPCWMIAPAVAIPTPPAPRIPTLSPATCPSFLCGARGAGSPRGAGHAQPHRRDDLALHLVDTAAERADRRLPVRLLELSVQGGVGAPVDEGGGRADQVHQEPQRLDGG